MTKLEKWNAPLSAKKQAKVDARIAKMLARAQKLVDRHESIFSN